jgi:hypothetical protein
MSDENAHFHTDAAVGEGRYGARGDVVGRFSVESVLKRKSGYGIVGRQVVTYVTAKEVIVVPNVQKRRPGCNRAAHDPE